MVGFVKHQLASTEEDCCAANIVTPATERLAAGGDVRSGAGSFHYTCFNAQAKGTGRVVARSRAASKYIVCPLR